MRERTNAKRCSSIKRHEMRQRIGPTRRPADRELSKVMILTADELASDVRDFARHRMTYALSLWNWLPARNISLGSYPARRLARSSDPIKLTVSMSLAEKTKTALD